MTTHVSTSKAGIGRGLIVLSWLASIAGLPICFLAFVGWSMSATMRPHATAGELLALFAAPLISGTALWIAVSRRKITPGGIAALIVPSCLAGAEIVFALVVWGAG
jgi:hypothetical protein